MISALLVIGAAEFTWATSRRVAELEALTVPRIQSPVADVKVPWLAVEETKASPAGSRSWTTTLVPVMPLVFETVRVNVTFDPSGGAALSTVIARARSIIVAGSL